MLTDRSSRGHGRARSLWNESPHQFAGGRYSKGMLLQLMGAFAGVGRSIIPQPFAGPPAKDRVPGQVVRKAGGASTHWAGRKRSPAKIDRRASTGAKPL